MSRATGTKSRAEKVKGGSSNIPAVAHEIVPGKFTDQDWFSMLDHDDSIEFAADLVDEIVVNTLSVIYDKYIQDQLLPFTISQAKDAILQIIEWQFLSRDELETNLVDSPTWQEDSEPVPALTDCWAQGVVPRQIVQISETCTPERTDMIVEDVEAEAEAEAELEQLSADEAEETERTEYPEVVAETPDIIEIDDNTAEKPLVIIEEKIPQPPAVKPKRKFKPHKGRLKSAGLGAVSETLHETEMRLRMQEQSLQMDNADLQSLMPLSQSALKSQAGRPVGNKDVVYDEQGNVVSMVKFNPAKLPSHFVKTGYCVVDPEVEAAHARLQAMRTGDYNTQAQQQKKKKPGSSSFTNRGQVSTASSLDRSIDISPGNLVLPLPPPLIEMMEIAPGVIVKEGERVKRGPKKWGKTGPQVPEQSLRVVRPPAQRHQFAAFDILGAEKPMLRLIRDSPVIPPISQQELSSA